MGKKMKQRLVIISEGRKIVSRVNLGGENSKVYDGDCKVFLLSSPAQIQWNSVYSRTKKSVISLTFASDFTLAQTPGLLSLMLVREC